MFGRCFAAAALILLAVASPASARALALGELVVVSSAGETLDGRIALVGAEGLRPQDITVALGSKEAFGHHGLERFGYLETLRFRVEPPDILVSSAAPMPDAYLNFLVRLTWPAGALTREYAVLLDGPERNAATPQAETPEATPSPSQRTLIVRPTDTLWSIAAANLPSDRISVQQHMLAILRENHHAFVAGNINGLVAGAILRLPDASAAMALPPEAAIDEAARQNDAWRDQTGSGQLQIIDLAEDGPQDAPAAEFAAEPPTPETGAEPPPKIELAEIPAPEPPLADVIEDLQRQVREQARQMERRDDEITRLNRELAALEAGREQQRQESAAALGRWRMAAFAGLLPTAGLLAAGLVALRRRRSASPSETVQALETAEAPDHDFGVSIGDGRVKLNMARAYIDLDDRVHAREMLEEVAADGTDEERQEAQALLAQLADPRSQDAPP